MSENWISDKKGWPTIRLKNTRSKAPWGYYRNPEDKWEFLPNMEKIMFAEKAMDFLDNNESLRETAAWLAKQTNTSISHQTLSNMWTRNRAKLGNPRSMALAAAKFPKHPPKPGQKEAAAIAAKKAVARRAITILEKKERALEEKFPKPDNGVLPDHLPAKEKKQPNVLFKPNPGPQTKFLAAPEKVVLYGGSAGGGKSFALIADPLPYFSNPNFSGVLFRRTNDELRDLISEAETLYKKCYPGVRWLGKKSMFVFPSGARLWLTYLEDDRDLKRYQGQAFSWIGWDELTHWPTSNAFDYMLSRNRSTDPTLPTVVRATTNPGSIGHAWVKKRFIDPAPEDTAFWARDDDTGKMLTYPEKYLAGHPLAGQPHEKAGQPLYRYRFIPAKLYDNPYLLQDGSYEAGLLAMPEMQRRQLLEGDWNVAEGAAFIEFQKSVHVIKPFEIPKEWKRFRSCDYGYSSFSAVHWFAIDPAFETLFVYRELYLSKHTGRDLAKAVLHAERGENILYGVLDSSVWHQRGQTGPSIAEEMISQGCKWRPADRSSGSRANGKNRLHELLKVDEDGRPGILFFDHCRQIITDLPVIPSSRDGSDDIDVRYTSDHSYDSLRYGIMSRPRSRSAFDFSGPSASSYTPSDSSFGY